MGGTEAPKKTSISYMKSLGKNFPLRFRSKNNSSLDGKEGPIDTQQDIVEEEPSEIATVNSFKAEESPANPKLVVRSTVPLNSPDSAEFGDPLTAPNLVYLTSYGGNMNYALTRAETNCGRKCDNHIILTDVTISKFHAIFYRKPEG